MSLAPQMDSFCVYKDKLKEALTLIPSMSHPKKLEAVSFWNNAATYFQNIVNPAPISPTEEQQQRDESNGQSYETNVDIGLSALVPNEEIDNNPNEHVTTSVSLGVMPDIGSPDKQFGINTILDDLLFSVPRNVIEESGQIQSNVMTEEINLLSIATLEDTQPIHHVDFNDTSTELGQDVSLASLVPIDPCNQRPIVTKSSCPFMLASDGSTSSTTDDVEDLHDSMVNQLQQPNYCTPVDIDDQTLIKPGPIANANGTSNLDNQNLLVTSCLDYSKTIQDNVSCTGNDEVTHDISNGQFDRGPEIANLSSSQFERSTTSFGTPLVISCVNSDSDETRPLQQIQIYAPSNENNSEFLFDANLGVNNQSGQLVAFNQRQSQLATSSGEPHLSLILSPETVNYAIICPQQTTEQPANIDSNSCAKSDKNPHTCEVCGKSGFSTKGNLKRHLKAHTGEKPFKCDHCNTRFTEKKSLKIHLRKHTGEKPYKCEICHQLFAQTAVLKSHMMSLHFDERKFACQKCDKAFKQSSQLKLHLMRHDGIKKLGCTKCQARFLTKGDLERHFRVHTGERPYGCHLCGKAFTRQQSLNEHLNRHYGKKPFTCKHCGKVFSEMSACYKVMSHSLLALIDL